MAGDFEPLWADPVLDILQEHADQLPYEHVLAGSAFELQRRTAGHNLDASFQLVPLVESQVMV